MKTFQALQQIVDFQIGVAVMRVLGVEPLAEHAFALINEQQEVRAVAFIEDGLQPLFGFADIFVDDLSGIEAIKLESELAR